MLSYHALLPCSATMLCYHAQLPGSATRLSYHAQLPSSATMLSYHAQLPCSATMLGYNVTRNHNIQKMSTNNYCFLFGAYQISFLFLGARNPLCKSWPHMCGEDGAPQVWRGRSLLCTMNNEATEAAESSTPVPFLLCIIMCPKCEKLQMQRIH